MSDKFCAMTVNAYVYLANLRDYVKKLEQGDADSSGSTLRTMGIVILAIAVVTVIGGAVYAFSIRVANTIGSTTFPW